MEAFEVRYYLNNRRTHMAPFFIAGFAGGIIRGFVGLIKYTMSYKDVTIRPLYFIGMILVSGLIGAAAAWTIDAIDITIAGVTTTSPAFALIAGYAGGDFLENLFKTIAGKKLIP